MKNAIDFFLHIDQKIAHYYRHPDSKELYKIIHNSAINPIIFYILFFIFNSIYYSNKYLFALITYNVLIIIIVLLKQKIKRKRPENLKGNFIKDILELKPDNYSFPSAHSFSMFQLVPLFFILFSYWGYLFLIYAIFIAFTRMYFKYHYLSDVLVGSSLGLLSGALVLKLFNLF